MDAENNGESSLVLHLAESLPESPELTVRDIHRIVDNHFGLRTTRPAYLDAEKSKGVPVGDFLVLYDVSRLLDIDAPRFTAAYPGGATMPDLQDVKDMLIQKAFIQQDSPLADCLTGLDELPEKYTAALNRFFTKQAIPVLKTSAVLSPDVKLGDYIATLPDMTPGLLLVRDTDPKELAYDHELYGGFGKRGRNKIGAEQMVSMERGITGADQQFFAKRYSPYLDLPAGKELRHEGLHSQRLFQHVDHDVARLLTDKTIRMMQRNLPPSV